MDGRHERDERGAPAHTDVNGRASTGRRRTGAADRVPAFEDARAGGIAADAVPADAVPWGRIVFVYAIGVLAAATLGRFAGLIPLLQRDLGLSLTVAAGLTSLIEVSGALFGFVAGMAVGRVGARISLVTGAAVLAVAGFGEAAAPSASVLIVWRAAESLGYLAITVGAPTLIVTLAGRQGRDAAMALWSTFVPVGLAIGTAVAAPVAELSSWRAVPAMGGIAAALLAAAAWLRLPRAAAGATPTGWREHKPFRSNRPERQGYAQAFESEAISGRSDQSIRSESDLAAAPGTRDRPDARMWLVALGFGLYAMMSVGILALTPTFMVDRFGVAPTAAGLIAGLASLANILGSIAAARAAALGVRPRTVALAGLGIPALILPVPFVMAVDWLAASAAIVAINAIGGMVAAVLFARVATFARTPRAVAMGNGLVAQFGASGSMIGPPLIAACVSVAGWPVAAVLGIGLSAFAIAAIAAAESRRR